MNSVRKSPHVSELLGDETTTATRWNSQFYMICCVLKFPEEKLNLVDSAQKLSHYEGKPPQELCSILEPLVRATIQQQNDVSAVLTVPISMETVAKK